MKRIILISAAILSFTAVFSMDITGNFTMEDRFSISNGDLLFNQESGSLKFEQAGENLYGMAQLGYRYYNNPIGQTTYNSILSAQELNLIYSVEPIELSLDQAYFTYKDFIIDRLDLSAGKQRIAWGTADKLNPTDLLNANDFSDPFDFGKKIPTIAVNLNYEIADRGNIQIVYEPYSPIARLNSLMESVTTQSITSNLSTNFSSYNSSSTVWNGIVNTPPVNASNFTIGTRLSGTIAGFDLSVSYISRVNDIPEIESISADENLYYSTIGQVTTSPYSANVTLNDASYNLNYFRENVIGFDFSKDLNFILLWGEASVTFQPEIDSYSTVTNHIYVNGIGNIANQVTNIEDVVLSNQVYVKYTIGFDKSFGDSWYINFQYNHGFFNERGNYGPERLEDYLVLRLEKKFFSDKLKLAVTGFYDVNDFSAAFNSGNFFNYLNNNYGIMGQFMISYTPVDDLNVEIGIYEFGGVGSTTLAMMQDYSLIYTKFTYSF